MYLLLRLWLSITDTVDYLEFYLHHFWYTDTQNDNYKITRWANVYIAVAFS